MQAGLNWIALYGAVAALYAVVALGHWRAMKSATGRPPAWAAAGLALCIVLHAVLLLQAMLAGGALHFGFAYALSATLWLTVLIVRVEGFFLPTYGLVALVLPPTAVAVALPALFPGSVLPEAVDSMLFRLHLTMAILSYSLLTIAAMYALLMAAMDRRLHGERGVSESSFGRFVERLPPLLAMEKLLFRLIGIGFALLTVTLVSGVFFSEQLFGKPLRFDHKSVFTIASWLVFAGLLIGRAAFGWRGRTALRWTLTGFVMLVLGYVGYRFVLEVILKRV